MLNPHPTLKPGLLYIDDEEKALKYFRLAFTAKFEVFTASSGKEGLEILRREASRIAIIISDQRMPEMLGAEILALAREEFPNIVRILTTAYSDLESAIQAVNQGHIYQYVVKPWEVPDLGMVLQRAADYYYILSERNELLALKMATLQRIICSDRLKWNLLSSREWDQPTQVAFRRALIALINALPEPLCPIVSGGERFDSRPFQINALIRDEYNNALRCLDSIDLVRSAVDGSTSTSQRVEAFRNAIITHYGLQSDEIVLTSNGESLIEIFFKPGSSAIKLAEFQKALFGVLLEPKTPELSLLFFQTLFSLTLGGKAFSLTLTLNFPETESTTLVFSFGLDSPDSSDAVINCLAEKFDQWDIAKL